MERLKMSRLRAFPAPSHTSDSDISVCYINVPHIVLRHLYIKNDSILQTTHISSFNETMLEANEQVKSSSLGMPNDMLIFQRGHKKEREGVLIEAHRMFKPKGMHVPAVATEVICVYIAVPTIVYIITIYHPSWHSAKHFISD